MPVCVCRRDPAVSSAAQTSPASLRAVRRTIIHGVPVRSPVQYAGTPCVQQWAGRYGTRHGTAMSHTHPPTTYPYLLQLQVVSPLYMQRVSKRVSVSGKKDCLSCQLFFSEQLEVEKLQTASMAQFCIKTYCCQMNFSVVTISEFWHLE